MAGSYCNSDVLSESTVECQTLQDVACSDHCAITVTLNFDQLPMTPSIEGQKAKHINWKFEDAGLKCRFYQWLDSMLDGAPSGLLWVNRGADFNRLDDLLTFMSNAILKSGKAIFGIRKPSKFNIPGWNEREKELNAIYRETVSPRSEPPAELKCRAGAAFRHEMKFLRENEDQLRSQSMLSQL